jgi:GNAT superfamily N-acetyltransferase
MGWFDDTRGMRDKQQKRQTPILFLVTAPLVVRDAALSDVEDLKRINNAKASAVHRDRIRDAHESYIRYLVLEQRGTISGYCVLVFRRPPSWSDTADGEHLPQVVDLYIEPEQRERGLGTFFLRQLESIVVNAGKNRLFIAVDPVGNPRVHALYLRLGYAPLEREPHRVHWHFVDSDGESHEGCDWSLTLRSSNLST